MIILLSMAIILACAVCYAIKGGQHKHVRRWLFAKLNFTLMADGKPMPGSPRWHFALERLLDGKVLSAILFAALVFTLVRFVPHPIAVLAAVGLPTGIISGILVFIIAAGAWLAAVSPSMGEEVGGVGGFQGAWGPYITARDAKGAIEFGRPYAFQKCLQRGVWHGAVLALAFTNLWFVIFGAALPLCAWLGITLQQRINKTVEAKPQVDWWLHEPIYGGIGTGIPLVIAFFW